MCGKWPPFNTILRFYLLCSLFVGFYFHFIESIIVGPALLEILSVEKCGENLPENLEAALDLEKVDRKGQTVSGSLKLPFDIDEKITLSLTGLESIDGAPKTEKRYINEKSFCRIMDNYLIERFEAEKHNSIRTFCPIPAGIYDIPNFSRRFNELNFPYEMLGYKKYQLELIRDDKVISCNVFHVNSLPQNTQSL